MKKFEIFRPGKHTASNGTTLEFSEDMLRAAVEGYDPELHEAPIVIGHPKDNHPAYGWVKGLSFAEDGTVLANPGEVDAEFSELVEAGRYKKRSASWYLPDAPNNPKPGTLYLRHVGFLGAQPPAIKGLKDVSFAGTEDGVIEFEDTAAMTARWGFDSLARIARNLREWLIGEKGPEEADKVVPNWLITDIEGAARRPESPPAAVPLFSEEDPMKIEELQAQVAALAQQNATLTAERDQFKTQAAQVANFAEQDAALKLREASIAASEARIARAEIEQRVDAIVKSGRLLPVHRKSTVDFAMGLAAGEATIDFGEGDKAKKVTQREAYLLQLESAPQVVSFGEISAPDGSTGGGGSKTPQQIAEAARELVNEAQAKGKTLSFTEAVQQVTTTQSTAPAA